MTVVRSARMEWPIRSQLGFDSLMESLKLQTSPHEFPETRVRALARIAILKEEYPDFYRVYDDGETIVRGLE